MLKFLAVLVLLETDPLPLPCSPPVFDQAERKEVIIRDNWRPWDDPDKNPFRYQAFPPGVTAPVFSAPPYLYQQYQPAGMYYYPQMPMYYPSSSCPGGFCPR